jgi:hypothetical protein
MSSSKSSVRIVLVDPRGEVLFSGESLRARGGEPPEFEFDHARPRAEAEDPCPKTMRSGSGVYLAVDRTSMNVTEVPSSQERSAPNWEREEEAA